MDRKLTDVMRHTRAQIDEKKREIQLYFAELKLKLPTYLKSLTIGELTAAGVIVNPDIYIPKETEHRLRTSADVCKKRADIMKKIDDAIHKERNQVINYYKNVKKQIPKDVLNKKMIELDKDEWLKLGIDWSSLIDSRLLEKTNRTSKKR